MPGMPGVIKISTENQARFQHIESRVKNILRFFDTENIKELGMNIDNRMMTVNGIKYCADVIFFSFFKIQIFDIIYIYIFRTRFKPSNNYM